MRLGPNIPGLRVPIRLFCRKRRWALGGSIRGTEEKLLAWQLTVGGEK